MHILQVSVRPEMPTTISGLIDLTKPLLRVVAREGLFYLELNVDSIKIERNGSELLADSRQVADVLGIEHSSLIRLIKDNPSDFGTIRFEIASSKMPNGSMNPKPESWAKIPEAECLLLITYVRNTEEAKKAKRALIAAFQAMHRKLVSLSKKSELDIKSTKARNSLTDQWKDHGLVGKEYALATVEEYKAVFKNPEIRKPEMTMEQKARLLIFETMEMLKLQQSPDVTGLPMVKQSIHATNIAIERAYKTIGLSK